MSTSVMKALRFAEFGPPSLLRIAEVTIPEPGEGGSNRSRDCCGDQPQRHRERLGTLQEHNFAANPRPRFCPRCCKGEAARRRRGLGQLPESRYRARWISRGIRRCPCRDAVAKTEDVEYGAGCGDRSSVRYGLGICCECSSNSTWREHSHRRRRGCGGPSSHTDQTGSGRALLAQTLHPIRFRVRSLSSIPRPKIFVRGSWK
jgi:hypothetical protein